jgi:hypothetical protein
LKSALSADGLETAEEIRKINQAADEAINNTKSFHEDAYHWTTDGHPVGHRALGLSVRRPPPGHAPPALRGAALVRATATTAIRKASTSA